ncbi:MAG: hypothetical protein KAU24_04130 [Candidatus Aenigmarchaeota archaeon]|nr:hypothetical protein [Candidatus Aenigmarchaeota archaeon]
MSSELIQTIFAVLVIILALAFSLTLEAKPSFETYGKAQARLWAKSIASTIDTMSGVEKGRVELDFGIVWDVEIKCNDECEVKVSHDKIKGKKRLLTRTDEVNLGGIAGILIEKEGDSVKVTGG